jgi:hypothetical protein
MATDNPFTLKTGNPDIPASVPQQSREIVVSWIALFLSLVVSAAVSVLIGQDVNWDLRNYHIYGGYAFITKRWFYDFAPAQLQTFFNPLLHVLTFLVREHFSPRSSAVIFGLLQGANIFFVFQISQVLFQRWELRRRTLLSAANAAAGFCAAVNIGEIGATFGDNMASIPMLGGILLFVRYFMSEKSEKRIPILYLGSSGILMGAALALKLTVVVYIIGIALALPAAMLFSLKRLRPPLLLAMYGGISIGFLAGYGVWGFRLYKAYQNPFFPFFNNIFRSPFYAFHNAMDATYIPHSWQDIFLYPFLFAQKTSLAGEQMHRDARWALCYIAIMILAAFALFRILGKTRKTEARLSAREGRCLFFLAFFITLSYACWQYLFSIYRYLSVLEWIIPVFLSLTIACFLHSQKRVLAVSLLINLIICLSVFPYDNGRINYDHDFLKVDIPPIANLDEYLILMDGPEPSSYIIPRFPPRTRFVRISANWMALGQNTRLDRQVHDLIARYDPSKILLYCANEKEIENADIALYPLGMSKSSHACWELGSPLLHKGFLCEVDIGIGAKVQSVIGKFSVTPLNPDIQSRSNPREVTSGKDAIVFRVSGSSVVAIDLLYTLDGRPMPPQRHWVLDSSQEIRMKVGPSTRKGLYHFIGIRDSYAPDPDRWIKIDDFIRIR